MKSWLAQGSDLSSCLFVCLCLDHNFCDKYIEDITWPRGDTKFLFEC